MDICFADLIYLKNEHSSGVVAELEEGGRSVQSLFILTAAYLKQSHVDHQKKIGKSNSF